jgi:hypothetical protein
LEIQIFWSSRDSCAKFKLEQARRNRQALLLFRFLLAFLSERLAVFFSIQDSLRQEESNSFEAIDELFLKKREEMRGV